METNAGEEMMATPVDPIDRHEGARKKTLSISNEHIDYMLDELWGNIGYGHLEVRD